MDLIHFLIDFILHIDVHLAELVAQYGVWVYAILFLILFCETGLVVTPFLPGDSLLFVAGALSALPTNDLNVHLMVLLMVIAVSSAMRSTTPLAGCSVKSCSAIRTQRYSVAAIWIKPTAFTNVTAGKPLSGALCADSPNLRAVCGGNGAYVLSSFCSL